MHELQPNCTLAFTSRGLLPQHEQICVSMKGPRIEFKQRQDENVHYTTVMNGGQQFFIALFFRAFLSASAGVASFFVALKTRSADHEFLT